MADADRALSSLADVVEMRKRLEQPDSDTPASARLDILAQLGKLTVTKQLLLQSKIGLSVNKQRKHTDEKVAATAKQLLASWKSAMGSNKGKPAAAPAKATATSSTTAATTSATASPAAASTEAGKSAFKLQSTGLKQRDAVQSLMHKALAGTVSTTTTTPVPRMHAAMWSSRDEAATELAVRAESALWDAHGHDANRYRQRGMGLVGTLRRKPKASTSSSTSASQQALALVPEFVRALLGGRVTPEKFALMTNEELADAAVRQKRTQDEHDASQEARSDANKDVATTDQFKCEECGQRACTYYQMQTRGADEPMTVFCTCTKCGHKFSVGSH